MSEESFAPDIPSVNRYAVVLEPTEEYFAWARVSPEGPGPDPAEMEREYTVFLIPELETDAKKWLRSNYKSMFEHELWAWCIDRELWPTDRSYAAFQKFFTVTVNSEVLDLGKGDVERENP